MVNKAFMYLLLSLFVLLLQCGFNIAGNDGGGGTETTNGVVYTTEGKPAQGALVRLIDKDNWLGKKQNNTSVVIDSAFTDSNGAFFFSRDTIKSCNLQVDGSHESIVLNNYSYTRKLDSTIRIELRKSASVRGTMQNALGRQSSIDLYGTSYSSAIGYDNSFSLPVIAPGDYNVYINIEKNMRLADTLSLSDGEFITDYDLDSFVYYTIEHFDDNTFYDSCPTVFGKKTGGIWFLLGKELLSMNDVFDYSIETYSKIYNDLYFYFRTIIPEKAQFSRGIGFTLAKDSSFNLSGSQVLSFYVNGHGNLRVIFYSKYVNSGSVDSLQFGKTINLDSVSVHEWNSIDIECDSLDMNWNSSMKNSYTDLQIALKTIYRIDFVFSSRENNIGDEIWMNFDDISIINQ